MTQKERSAKFYHNRKENGLCPRCGKPLDREGYYCSECLGKVRIYNRKTKEFYRKHNLCSVCGKNSVPKDERTCPECRAKRENRKKELTKEQRIRYGRNFRKNQKNIYKERVEKGICTRCGKRKASSGKKKCAICLAKDAEKHRLKCAERNPQNVIEYRRENHLCYFCGKPIDLPSGNICSECCNRFKSIAKERIRKMQN